MAGDVALWNLETGSALKEMLWLIRKYVWYKYNNNKIPNSGVVKAGNTSANQKTVRHSEGKRSRHGRINKPIRKRWMRTTEFGDFLVKS